MSGQGIIALVLVGALVLFCIGYMTGHRDGSKL